MDKVNDFLINQNLRIKRLRERLNMPPAEKKTEPDKEKKPKKKEAINKELTYMLIIGFVLCVVSLLYFYSSVYFYSKKMARRTQRSAQCVKNGYRRGRSDSS